MDQDNTPTRKALWVLAVIAVLVYALIPVIWIISLSLKTPGSIGDGSFLPSHWTFDNYHTAFNAGFFTAWTDFLFAYALTATNAALTAPVALSYFPAASQFQAPQVAIAAGAVIVTVPILIMVLIFQRRIVSGLTAGAVKG